jgi:hypothetical protein
MPRVDFVLLITAIAISLRAQDAGSIVPLGQSAIPDPPAAHALESPDPVISATAAPAPSVQPPSYSDTHMFGVVPNYNAVNDPDHPYVPLTVGAKFMIAAHDAFDPFSWVTTALYAGVEQWQGQYPQFGQGSKGYAKRYGGAFADGGISNYISEAILPSLLHQDPRYFRLGKGTALHRIGYTISREWITRVDSGKERFNISELAGNLGAAAISNLYYPAQERSASETMEKFAVNIVSDAGFNVLKEFWPDWRHKFLHKPLSDAP